MVDYEQPDTDQEGTAEDDDANTDGAENPFGSQAERSSAETGAGYSRPSEMSSAAASRDGAEWVEMVMGEQDDKEPAWFRQCFSSCFGKGKKTQQSGDSRRYD